MAEAWSMLPWLAGAIWAVAGRPALRWSLPAILFLGFMIPLPYRAETFLSLPLQSTATTVSCWMLQTLGQPAVSAGNVIFVDETPLFVAEACSGLRIFTSILALAYIYLVFASATVWTRLGILASILPIAIFSNCLRIVGTALLHRATTSGTAREFFHDASGLLMIPVAAGCFACVVWYWRRVFVRVEPATAGDLLAE
jgi:exosortase